LTDPDGTWNLWGRETTTMGKILFAAAMSHMLDSRRRALVVAVALGLAGTLASAQKPRDAATLRLDF
jgi:hypothetical protein